MASSVDLPFALYRYTTDVDTEANLGENESVGFSYGINEQSEIGIISFKAVGDARITDVPAPDQSSTNKPDTGNVGPIWELQFVVNEKTQDSTALPKLWRWYLERKVVRTVFSRGRFGIRNDSKPWLNVIPTRNSGLKLIHVEMDDVIEYGGLVIGSITLQLAGTNSQIITRILSELADDVSS